MDMSKLKPLVWRLVNDYPNSAVCPVYEADSVFGVFRVSGAARGYAGSNGSPSFTLPDGTSDRCVSITEGQERCWIYYRRRVAGLFETTN